MQHYKAPDNSLHVIEPEFAHMLPPGCVEITEQEAAAIRAASVPQPTQAELIAATLSKARAMRLPIMQVLDGMQASALVNGTTITVGGQPKALAVAIEECKQALRALPQQVDLSQATNREQMEQIVAQAYYTIVLAAPPEIKSAFDSLKP